MGLTRQNWTFDKPTKEQNECLSRFRSNTNLNTRQMDAVTVPSQLCFSVSQCGLLARNAAVMESIKVFSDWRTDKLSCLLWAAHTTNYHHVILTFVGEEMTRCATQESNSGKHNDRCTWSACICEREKGRQNTGKLRKKSVCDWSCWVLVG